MPRLEWDKEGEHLYETGIDHVTLYLPDSGGGWGAAYAWNGVTSISDSPEGAEANPVYADNIKYLNLISNEEQNATLEAYSSPEEFDSCDGTLKLAPGIYIGQQRRQRFGLAYRTRIGNDVQGDSFGYKIHLLYNCTAAPSERTYETVNDSPEAATLSWEISTTPVPVTGIEGARPTASVVLSSDKVPANSQTRFWNCISAVLFGADEFDTTKIYNQYDAVTHSGSTYYAKNNLSAGAWNASNWTQIVSYTGPKLLLPDEINDLLWNLFD